VDDNVYQVETDDLSGRFLLFYIGETTYSLPLTHVIEIINIQHITKIPNVPYYVKGIVNLRGKVVPVSDVRLKFNQPERPYDDKTCIVVVLISDMNVGLIVDSVAEVVSIERTNMAPPPTAGHRGGESYLDSVSQLNGKVILNIDCDKFFQSDLAELFPDSD
jgi:purine-binding chemotaxis protein CheW